MLNLNPYEFYLAQFAHEIETSQRAIHFYSKQATVNAITLKKRTEATNRLVSIYNGFEGIYKNVELIYPYSQPINKLIESDPEIGTIQIRFHLKQNSNIALIDLNPIDQ